MATQASLEIETQLASGNIDLEEIVSEATWRDILIDLVRANKIDPWNIDIVQVVDKYVDVIKKMKVLDLRIPANIILAAAVLLRLKSEMIKLEEQEALQDDQIIERPPVTVEALNFRIRIPPKRRMTLEELVSALDEAMKMKEIKEVAKREAPIDIPITLSGFDIEAEIEKVYQHVKNNVDKSKMTTFSILAKLYNSENILLGLFIPLLFLTNAKKITLIQEKFFEEIIIGLN